LNKRRDATRVIHDILLLGRMGASKTQVISKANLSFPLADRYISFLLSKGHLRLGLDPRGVRRYTLTSKGERLLGFLGDSEGVGGAVSQHVGSNTDCRSPISWILVRLGSATRRRLTHRLSGPPVVLSSMFSGFWLEEPVQAHGSIWKERCFQAPAKARPTQFNLKVAKC